MSAISNYDTMPHSEEDTPLPESRPLIFVKLLQSHRILLSKSQIPKIRAEKERAAQAMMAEYECATGMALTEKQLMKKLNNMKNDVKVKSDITRTGNNATKLLKDWESLLLEIMLAEKYPVCTDVNGGSMSVEIQSSSVPDPNGRSSSPSYFMPVPPRTTRPGPLQQCEMASTAPPWPVELSRVAGSFPSETDETRELSNAELQRLVLLEQLRLVRMQQQALTPCACKTKQSRF